MTGEKKDVALGPRQRLFVMGDTDRKEFHFNEILSYEELLELLERNAYMSILCDWMVAEAVKNGFEMDKEGQVSYTDRFGVEKSVSFEEYIELIKFMNKIHRGKMFARLHGESIGVFFDDKPDLSKKSESGKYTDFEIYHRLAFNNGFRITKVDDFGQPTEYDISVMNVDDISQEPKKFKVTADRVVVFANPKKGATWGGTPSSKLIGHYAQVYELTVKWMAKHALDIASPFWLVEEIDNEAKADEFDEEMSKSPLTAIYVKGNVKMTPMILQPKGYAVDFKTMLDILKDYMAAAMRVSRQAMDGAPEGTLSSAAYNTIMSNSTIIEIQEHFKATVEECLAMLNIDVQITWNPPLELEEIFGKEKKDGEGVDTPTNVKPTLGNKKVKK